MSRINRPLAHNDPSLGHKEKMILRKAQRHSRVRVPYPLEYHFKTSKYDPKTEDQKHLKKDLTVSE